MTYARQDDEVTLTMTVVEHELLIYLLGLAASVPQTGSPAFWDAIRFVNDINNGNPHFTPYEIPEPVNS